VEVRCLIRRIRRRVYVDFDNNIHIERERVMGEGRTTSWIFFEGGGEGGGRAGGFILQITGEDILRGDGRTRV
jgi:hypothetical protein